MQPLGVNVRAFTTSYEGLSRVLRNKVQIGQAFDPSCNPTPPECKEFNAIWDTGATGTAVSRNVVDACSLKPTGVAKVETPKGSFYTNTYFVSVVLPNRVGVPQLRVAEAQLAGGAEVLVGMDVITRGDFAVTNRDGKTVFTYRMPSLERIDFVKQQPATVLDQSGRPIHKVGRNDPCPCGSGKKYKKCCGV